MGESARCEECFRRDWPGVPLKLLSEYEAEKKAGYARVDHDRTAKPLTRIVHHPDVSKCFGPGSKLTRPEYEAEDGTRTPLEDLPGDAQEDKT
jgi:hypothetical protein